MRFVSNDQFNLSGFSDVKFDRVLAHAVEIHLSDEQAGQALKSISNYLSFDAKLYFSHRTPWLYRRMGAAAFEKQFRLVQTNEFFFRAPCTHVRTKEPALMTQGVRISTVTIGQNFPKFDGSYSYCLEPRHRTLEKDAL